MEPLHGTNLGLVDQFRKSKVGINPIFEDLSGPLEPCTPEMTNCSSRSSASSVVAASEHNCTSQCDGLNRDQCCVLQAFSDTESLRYSRSEPDGLPPGLKGTPSYVLDRSAPFFGYSVAEVCDSIFPPPRTEQYSLDIASDVHQSYDPPTSCNNMLLKDHTKTRFSQIRPSPFTTTTASVSAARDDNTDSEDDEETDEVDDDDDDDDWSGEDSNLEASILEALGHDFELAAHLIPRLHQILYPEAASVVSSKVGMWRNTVTDTCTADSRTGSAQSSTSNVPTNNTGNEQRKRSRRQEADDGDESKEDDDDDDEDGEERGSKRLKDNDNGTVSTHYWLACPFHKMDPSKYGQHGGFKGKKGQYRTCAGPGFKSIQRLKEHLKRTHTPVQCERCYHIFEGGDRATRVASLEFHRQLAEPCSRNPRSLKEGISEAQWASLDEKRHNKKNKGASFEKPKTNVEKWNDIWIILFPDIPPPKTPWYDQSPTESSTSSIAQGGKEFTQIFDIVLSHKVNENHIRLEDGVQARISDVARIAFDAWSSTARWGSSSSSTFSVSGGSHPQSNRSVSLIGGSYHHVSTPETSGGQKRHRAQSAESVPAHIYPMEIKDDLVPQDTGIIHHNRTGLSGHADQNILTGYVALPEGREPNFTNDMLINSAATSSFTDLSSFLQSNFSSHELTNNEWDFANPDSTASNGFPGMHPNINQDWHAFGPPDFGHS